MTKIRLLGDQTTVDRQNIGSALQQAIGIEVATIPTYLYTYYSVARVPDQPSLNNGIYKELIGAGMTPTEATPVAQELSARIMVFANKVGAMILSVAIEEMLHMSLAANVKQSIVGLPQLIGLSPFQWRAQLPGHTPEFDINKAKFSLAQLKTFLYIESPKTLTTGTEEAANKAISYTTIGEFYSLIEQYISQELTDADFDHTRPQLVPGRGYYAQNCIDTVYYDKQHKPRFTSADDSGNLIHVVDKASALAALQLIVDQGEGFNDKGLNPDDSVNCGPITPGDYDDVDHKELSHFAKFNQLYCQLVALNKEFELLTKGKVSDASQYFVKNLPKNPSTSDYPADIQTISNLLNAVYSYIFVMTEACYRKDGNTQYEIFMFGIHKSMMWILDNLCNAITGYSYTVTEGNETITYQAAATFEEYPFSRSSSPKSQIIALYNTMLGSYPNSFGSLKDRINDLPDVTAEGRLFPDRAILD